MIISDEEVIMANVDPKDYLLGDAAIQPEPYPLATDNVTVLPIPEDPEREHSSWDHVDLSDVEIVPITTSIGRRSDGKYMLYSGKINWMSSEPEQGKSWAALHMIAQLIKDGKKAVYIDFEDGPATFLERLQQLGVPEKDIKDHEKVRYIRPEEPLGIQLQRDPHHLPFWQQMLEWKPDLVCFDASTEAMTLEGLSIIDNADTANFFRDFLRPLTNSGAAVLVLDHMTKSHESNKRFAIGAQHKLAAVDGIALIATMKKHWGRPEAGSSHTQYGQVNFAISKDRPGVVRGLAGSDQIAFAMNVTAYPDAGVSIAFDSYQPTESKAEEKRDLIMLLLHKSESPLNTSKIIKSGSITGNEAAKTAALNDLITEGLVLMVKKGNENLHSLTDAGKLAVSKLEISQPAT